MIRRDDWPQRLNEYLTACRDKKFQLGKFDCAKFAAGAIKAMTDEDVMPVKYSTKKEAVKLMAQKPMTEWLAEVLEPCHPAKAQRGDIGVFDGACGVVIGRYTIFAGDQWMVVPTLKLEAAFHA